MTKRFVKNIWEEDTEPDMLKIYKNEYYKDRRIILNCMKVGDILTSGYFDADSFEITRINKKTGEITIEYLASTAGL